MIKRIFFVLWYFTVINIKTVELQMVKNIRTMPNAAGVVETPFVFVPCLSEKGEKMSHLGLNEYQQKQQQKKNICKIIWTIGPTSLLYIFATITGEVNNGPKLCRWFDSYLHGIDSIQRFYEVFELYQWFSTFLMSRYTCLVKKIRRHIQASKRPKLWK